MLRGEAAGPYRAISESPFFGVRRALARDGYRSKTLTALNANGVNLASWFARAKERGVVVGNGYGKTKGQVFRIGHMGEWTPEALDQVLAMLDEELN